MAELIKIKSFEKNIINSLSKISSNMGSTQKLSVFVIVLLEELFKNNINICNQIKLFLENENILNKTVFNEEYTKIKFMISKIVKSLSPKQIEHSINNTYRDNYNEICKISEGSFGTVYKVFNIYEKNYYAIKKIFITEELLDNNYNFFKEIQIFSKLYHNNIVRFYSSFVSLDDKSIDDFNNDDIDIKIDNKTSILFIQM